MTDTKEIIRRLLESQTSHPGGFAGIMEWLKKKHPEIFDIVIQRLTDAINLNYKEVGILAGVIFRVLRDYTLPVPGDYLWSYPCEKWPEPRKSSSEKSPKSPSPRR